MPPNAHQDVHGSSGGLAMTPPPATAASKMDCFLTTVGTPLNLQVRTQVPALRHVQRRAVSCRVASCAKEFN